MGRWFSPVSSTNKTDHHDITEILLTVALNTITLTPHIIQNNTNKKPYSSIYKLLLNFKNKFMPQEYMNGYGFHAEGNIWIRCFSNSNSATLPTVSTLQS
jgi:hypothetical protein